MEEKYFKVCNTFSFRCILEIYSHSIVEVYICTVAFHTLGVFLESSARPVNHKRASFSYYLREN